MDWRLASKLLLNETMVEILELRDCKLKIVPQEILKLPRLRVLKLENNFIKAAPAISVEVLSFRNNLL